MTDLNALLDRCAEQAVLIDLVDWQAVAIFQGDLNALAAAAERAGKPAMATAARTAAATLDRALVTDLTTDAGQAIRREVGEAIARAQASLAPAAGEADRGRTLGDFLTAQAMVGEELSALILRLERGDDLAPPDLRRRWHTLKGEAGMAGLDHLNRVCHLAEDLLLLPGELLRRPGTIAALLAAADWAGAHLAALRGEGQAPPADDICRQLERAAAGSALARHGGPPPPTPTLPAAPAHVPVARADEDPQGHPLSADCDRPMLAEFIGEAGEHLQQIEAGLLGLGDNPGDADLLNATFRSFHTVKGLAGFLELKREQRLAHAAEELLDRLRSGRLRCDRPALDLLLAAFDCLTQLVRGLEPALEGAATASVPQLPELLARLRAHAATADPDAAAPPPAEDFQPPTTRSEHAKAPGPAPDRSVLQQESRRIGDVLVETGLVTKPEIELALDVQRRQPQPQKLGEILVDQGRLSKPELDAALAAQKQGGVQVRPQVRIDVEHVDRLGTTVGELVIAANMLACADELKALGSRRVRQLLGQLDRVTRSIESLSMRLRLVPVRPVFQRMQRVVRDLAPKLGKEIDFASEGEDAELDKAVVDRLADPLVHLVRNSLDHGLEGPEERLKAGKPRRGRLTLRAFRESGAVCIECADDGRGLNRERILAKAVERGLVAANAQLDDDEVFRLVLRPGFSTAEKVTDVSGRGVGLDVVARTVDELRGRILIRSEPGRGSVFCLRLPLTMAIIDGMLVSVAGQRYIVPTLALISTTRAEPGQVATVQGRGELIAFQGAQLPLFRLGELLGLPVARAARPLVMVVQDGEQRFGLVVDAILGRQQVVLKAVGEGLPPVPGMGGATITGDGRVCLVVDVHALFAYAQSADRPPPPSVDEPASPGATP